MYIPNYTIPYDSTDDDDLILVCSCSSLDHVVRFSTSSPDDGDVMGYISVVLPQRGTFLGRLMSAWRYLWRKNCRFVIASEVLLSEMDVPKLQAWLDKQKVNRRSPSVAKQSTSSDEVGGQKVGNSP